MPQHMDRVTLALVSLILAAFVIGAFKVNQQAAQINQIIDDQSPLVFAFPGTGGANVTFVVNCVRLEDESKYACTTTQQSNNTAATPPAVSPTPIRVPTPTVTPTPIP